MKQRLEQIAEANNWAFNYGRLDFLNLPTTHSNEFYFFADAIEETIKYDDFSNVESKTYSGRFWLCLKSDFDRVYNNQENNTTSEGKYDMYIKRCKEEIKKIPLAFQCEDLYIKNWKELEIINAYDENFDGVLVNYSIEEH